MEADSVLVSSFSPQKSFIQERILLYQKINNEETTPAGPSSSIPSSPIKTSSSSSFISRRMHEAKQFSTTATNLTTKGEEEANEDEDEGLTTKSITSSSSSSSSVSFSAAVVGPPSHCNGSGDENKKDTATIRSSSFLSRTLAQTPPLTPFAGSGGSKSSCNEVVDTNESSGGDHTTAAGMMAEIKTQTFPPQQVTLAKSPFIGRCSTLVFTPCDRPCIGHPQRNEKDTYIVPSSLGIDGFPCVCEFESKKVNREKFSSSNTAGEQSSSLNWQGAEQLEQLQFFFDASRFSAILCTLKSNGLTETKKVEQDWVLNWSRTLTYSQYSQLKSFQKVNHFPGTWGIGRKDTLHKTLSVAIEKFGRDVFSFVPMGFLLPNENHKFDNELMEQLKDKETKGKQLYISKPVALARGRGVKLFSSTGAGAGYPATGKRCIVQRYIDDPLLVHSRKFDLRIYVVVTSFYPLKIYVYPEGLVRFASTPYPTTQQALTKNASLNLRTAHLTNYSVNKKNEDEFVKPTGESTTEDEYGSMWNMATLQRYFEREKWNWHEAQRNIDDLIVKTIIAYEPQVVNELHAMFPQANFLIPTTSSSNGGGPGVCRTKNCFQIYGFDVLLRSNLSAVLMEVNVMPDMSTSWCPLDQRVTTNMLADMLTLIGLSPPMTCGEPTLPRGISAAQSLSSYFQTTTTTTSPTKMSHTDDDDHVDDATTSIAGTTNVHGGERRGEVTKTTEEGRRAEKDMLVIPSPSGNDEEGEGEKNMKMNFLKKNNNVSEDSKKLSLEKSGGSSTTNSMMMMKNKKRSSSSTSDDIKNPVKKGGGMEGRKKKQNKNSSGEKNSITTSTTTSSDDCIPNTGEGSPGIPASSQQTPPRLKKSTPKVLSPLLQEFLQNPDIHEFLTSLTADERDVIFTLEEENSRRRYFRRLFPPQSFHHALSSSSSSSLKDVLLSEKEDFLDPTKMMKKEGVVQEKIMTEKAKENEAKKEGNNKDAAKDRDFQKVGSCHDDDIVKRKLIAQQYFCLLYEYTNSSAHDGGTGDCVGSSSPMLQRKSSAQRGPSLKATSSVEGMPKIRSCSSQASYLLPPPPHLKTAASTTMLLTKTSGGTKQQVTTRSSTCTPLMSNGHDNNGNTPRSRSNSLSVVVHSISSHENIENTSSSQTITSSVTGEGEEQKRTLIASYSVEDMKKRNIHPPPPQHALKRLRSLLDGVVVVPHPSQYAATATNHSTDEVHKEELDAKNNVETRRGCENGTDSGLMKEREGEGEIRSELPQLHPAASNSSLPQLHSITTNQSYYGQQSVQKLTVNTNITTTPSSHQQEELQNIIKKSLSPLKWKGKDEASKITSTSSSFSQNNNSLAQRFQNNLNVLLRKWVMLRSRSQNMKKEKD